jgi:predicted acyltransferase
MPALATTLIGVVATNYLRSNTPSKERVVNLLLFGFLGVAVGLIWNFWFPINKNLWTSSYVAFTGGIALILLAAAYHLVDLKEHRTWTKPFVILGANAILVYVLSELMHYVEYSNIAISGVQVQLKPFIYENYFASWAGSLNGSLLYSLAYLMFWLAIMAVLFKRRIFIKI